MDKDILTVKLNNLVSLKPRNLIFALLTLQCALFSSLSYASETTTATNNQPVILNVVREPIVVNGKKSMVYNIVQPNGKQGYEGIKGQDFNTTVVNKTNVPIVIHWHGLVDPNDQDGVPYVTQLPIPPGKEQQYRYPLVQSGTYWMHSHEKFQEQELMAAPFIIKDPTEKIADQEVVVMFQDFTFRNPEEVYAELRKKLPMNMGSTPKQPPMNMQMKKPLDLNDVKFDAYLTNRRTLQNPEIVRVKPRQVVRLRLINAAASTNFWVDTGKLTGTVIAIDGANTKPLKGNKFELGLANRLDVLVTIPDVEGAYPILAQPEGTTSQTGLILATPGATIPTVSESTTKLAPPLDNSQELKLKAVNPLPKRPVNKVVTYTLEGDMKTYTWTINNQIWPKITPSMINKGQRIEMIFINNTGMTHPMHFHGHVFQLTSINGKTLADGPLHDSILVLPNSTMKIQFDADNPGIWLMHCHILYHAKGGMDTTANYVGYPEPSFYKKLIGK